MAKMVAKNEAVWSEALAGIRGRLAGTRDADELAQEALCQAWALAESCGRRGKDVNVGSFIYFGVKRALSGRKFAGDSERDISRSTKPAGSLAIDGCKMVGLSQWARNSAQAKALAGMILAEGICGLTRRQRIIVARLAEGHRRSFIARILGVSPATITAEIYTIMAVLES